MGVPFVADWLQRHLRPNRSILGEQDETDRRLSLWQFIFGSTFYVRSGAATLICSAKMSDSEDWLYAPNKSIDRSIQKMLPDFSEGSQRRMKKAIRDAARAAMKHQDENTDAGARHIFREFIPASNLNRFGYDFEYECKINGKTPDWYEVDSCILMDSYTFERGGSSSFLKRVKSAVTAKCGKYSDIIESNSLRFVVSVYLDFCTGIDFEECLKARESFRQTFIENPGLWGILFFEEVGSPFVKGTEYRFMCFSADESYREMERWMFHTIPVHS